MRRCCQEKAPKAFALGALTFLLPKCPLCIPGFMALLGAAGLQMGFGVGLIFALKCLGAVLLLSGLAFLLRKAQLRRKTKRLMMAAKVNIS